MTKPRTRSTLAPKAAPVGTGLRTIAVVIGNPPSMGSGIVALLNGPQPENWYRFEPTNLDGYATAQVDGGLTNSAIRIDACGCQSYAQSIVLTAGVNQTIRIGGPAVDPTDIVLPGLVHSFPDAPTREQVCKILVGFQGLTVHLAQFGAVPAFGPETSSLSDADLISYCQQQKAWGATHVEFDLSWQYVERDYSFWCPGRDLSQNLPELRRRIELCIQQGMLIKLALAGDGISVNDDPQPGEYNDPQGWTYGYQWLLANIGRIVAGLDGSSGLDLTKFIAFTPGYDGVFYGWSIPNEVPDLQPYRVAHFGQAFRAVCPNGYLVLEMTPGDIPVGNGPVDYAPGGMMAPYDAILTELNADPDAADINGVQQMVTGDQVWQPTGRMTRQYVRPSDQPAGDDPHPPYYFAIDTPRGPRYFIKYEYFTYYWVRGRVSVEKCQRVRAYLQALDGGGETVTC